jgi:hypothetical protein
MRVPVLVATLLVGLGTAQADPTSQKKADDLFAQGRKRIEAHDDIGACEKFNEAIKLDPDAAGTMLNLGLCNQNLKKYRLALYWFRKAQARAHETNLPEYETAAGQRTKDLVELVATIKIELGTATPPDARIRIDGEEIAAADYLHVEIDSGHHTLDARAPHHIAKHEEFDVVGKGGQTVTVNLVEGDDSIVIDRGAGRRKVAVITAIGGGVLLASSGIVSIVARSRYNNCVKDGKADPSLASCMTALGANVTVAQATNYANDQQHLARWVATPLFAVGLIGVGVATALYVTAPTRERVDRTVFVPTVAADGVGFAAIGRF